MLSSQATKLTKACQKLKRLGHEARARPFTYQNVRQEELDSLLTYMSSLELSVCAQVAQIVGVFFFPFAGKARHGPDVPFTGGWNVIFSSCYFCMCVWQLTFRWRVSSKLAVTCNFEYL